MCPFLCEDKENTKLKVSVHSQAVHTIVIDTLEETLGWGEIQVIGIESQGGQQKVKLDSGEIK